MLLVVTVTANSKSNLNVGSRLIRTEAVSKLVVYSTTGSKFDFPMSERDRRVSKTHLKCSDSVADIQNGMNLAYNQVDITLPVHEYNNVSNSTINEIYNVADIVWGQNSATAGKSWIFVNIGAFEVKKLLVDYTIAEIAELAETGAVS
jgi:hypothetical protein